MAEFEEGVQEDDAGVGPVVVFRCPGDVEAGVVRSLLEAYGIPVVAETDISHIPYPLRYDGLGEVRLKVPANLAAEAERIIAAHAQPDRHLSAVPSEDPPDGSA